jgi:hypothetical protein
VSRVQLLAADILLIGAGLAWAFIAGAASIVVARDGWPPASIGVSLMILPYFGMLFEFVLIALAAAGRFRTTVFLSAVSLLAALVLFGLEFSGKFIGYR